MAETKLIITARDETKAAFQSVQHGLSGLNKHLGGLLGPLTALTAGGGFALLIKQNIDIADSTGKAARRIGETAEALSEMRYAAKLADIGAEELDQQLGRMVVNVSRAAAGGGEATKALQLLGISAAELAQKTPSEQLRVLADRLLGVENDSDRARIAVEIFGKSGLKMLNLLEGGSAGLDAAAAEARSFGAVITTEATVAAEQFNDNLTRLQTAGGRVGISLANSVLPTLVDMTNQFLAAYQAGGFLEAVLAGISGAGISTQRRIQAITGQLEALEQELKRVNEQTQIMGLEFFDDDPGFIAEKIEAQMEKLRKEKAILEDLLKPPKRDKPVLDVPSGDMRGALPGKDEGETDLADPMQGDDGFGALEEQLRGRLERLSLSQLTEQEQLAAHLEQTRMMLDEAFVLDLISEEEQYRLLEDAEQRHQNKLGDLVRKGKLDQLKFDQLTLGQKVQAIIGFGQAELAAVANTNKTIFDLHRKLSLAQLAIAAPAAIGEAVKNAGGLPFGLPAGIMTAAKYALLISQAKSANFGSSTSPANVAGGGAVPVQPVGAAPESALPVLTEAQQPQRPERVVNVNIRSGIYSANEIRDTIIPEIIEALGDGVGRSTMNVSVV